MTDYANDVAKEYGFERNDTGYLLDGHVIIDVYQSVASEKWCWELHPLGDRGAVRSALGFAETGLQALQDAEGMLRHYLISHTREEVLKVWSEDTLRRINLKGWV